MSRQKKPPRIDTSPERKPLSDTPFGNLNLRKLPTGEPAHETPPPPATGHPYRVCKTAKGGYHLSIEKRAAGKVVTVLHGVEGDGAALARELKKNCGIGGTYADGRVELQGNVRNKIETLLTKLLG